MKCSSAQLAYQKQYDRDHAEEKSAYRATHRAEKSAYMASRYQCHKDEFIRQVESESQAEGPKAVAELKAFRDYYRAAHVEEVAARAAAHYREKHDEFTEWLQILRTNNGCEDCETHEGRLDFHHIDPGTRKYKISQMYGCSLDVLEEELEKCVVLCGSCHQKRHVAMRECVQQ